MIGWWNYEINNRYIFFFQTFKQTFPELCQYIFHLLNPNHIGIKYFFLRQRRVISQEVLLELLNSFDAIDPTQTFYQFHHLSNYPVFLQPSFILYLCGMRTSVIFTTCEYDFTDTLKSANRTNCFTFRNIVEKYYRSKNVKQFVMFTLRPVLTSHKLSVKLFRFYLVTILEASQKPNSAAASWIMKNTESVSLLYILSLWLITKLLQ